GSSASATSSSTGSTNCRANATNSRRTSPVEPNADAATARSPLACLTVGGDDHAHDGACGCRPTYPWKAMTTLRAGGSAAPRDPALFGPYRLVHRIGEGGMGVVHLALDEQGRAVALKVLRDHVCADPEARARLRREVE